MKVLSDPVPVSWNIEKVCDANDIYGVIGCGATLEVDYTDIYTKEYEKGYWSSSDQEFVHYMAHEEIPEKIRIIILNREKEKKLERRRKAKKKS